MTVKPLVIKAGRPDEPPGTLFGPATVALKEGGVVAYPTETFYGLAVDPFNPVAVKRLFSLKGRAAANPISLIIADKKMLEGIVADVPRAAVVLMDRFWPGPLTLVFKASPSIPASLIAGTGRVGVRLSSHPVAQALSAELSSPITATSANPSGERPPVSANEALSYFGTSLAVLIDGGTLTGRLGSTVVDVSEGKAVVLREGEIPSSEILKALA